MSTEKEREQNKKRKRLWRTKIKSRGVQALGGKCAICGQTFEDCCYDFHHLDPEEKDFNISQMNTNGANSWIEVRDELKKCVLLCANCHRLLHNGFVELKDYLPIFDQNLYDWDMCGVKRFSVDTQEEIIRKTSNICPKCGGIKSYNSKLCNSCSKIHEPKFYVSREELKKLIRQKSFLEIGRLFSVSDRAIKNRCIKYGMPYRKKDINSYSDSEWDLV